MGRKLFLKELKINHGRKRDVGTDIINPLSKKKKKNEIGIPEIVLNSQSSQMLRAPKVRKVLGLIYFPNRTRKEIHSLFPNDLIVLLPSSCGHQRMSLMLLGPQ